MSEIQFDRRRNIKWSDMADSLAVSLSHRYGFERGVSELLEKLVIADSKRKRGIAHLHGDPKPDSESTTKRHAPKTRRVE